MSMQKTQQGFSLIELMISITIGLVLMTGVVQMFVTSKTVFSTQQGISRIQESGRLAINFLAKDIREAGYMGCISRTAPRLTSTLNNPTSFLYDFGSSDSAIIGYTNATIPAGAALNPAPRADTDVLVVRSAAGNGASTSAVNNPTTLTVALSTEPGQVCPSDICDDDILIVTDCAKARIFQVTSAVEAGADVTITHTGGDNADSSWGGGTAGPEESFQVGSEVINIRTTVYYIADNPDGNPSLYQKVGVDPAFELLQGVEDMSLQFGVDAAGEDYIVEAGTLGVAAVTAADNWEDVRSVMVQLLVRSIDDNVSPNPQTYTFDGTEVTADDKRIRHVFSTAVGIRSRLQ